MFEHTEENTPRAGQSPVKDNTSHQLAFILSMFRIFTKRPQPTIPSMAPVTFWLSQQHGPVLCLPPRQCPLLLHTHASPVPTGFPSSMHTNVHSFCTLRSTYRCLSTDLPSTQKVTCILAIAYMIAAPPPPPPPAHTHTHTHTHTASNCWSHCGTNRTDFKLVHYIG